MSESINDLLDRFSKMSGEQHEEPVTELDIPANPPPSLLSLQDAFSRGYEALDQATTIIETDAILDQALSLRQISYFYYKSEGLAVDASILMFHAWCKKGEIYESYAKRPGPSVQKLVVSNEEEFVQSTGTFTSNDDVTDIAVSETDFLSDKRSQQHRLRRLASIPIEERQRIADEARRNKTMLTQDGALDHIKAKQRKEVEAKNAVEREQLKANPKPLPNQKYKTIVLDPPWKLAMAKEPDNLRQTLQYPHMEIDEIKALPVPNLLEEDARIFLWAINRFLPDAYDLIKHWGLDYRFTMVWKKTTGMKPVNYPQMNAEYIIVATRGNTRNIGFYDETNFYACFEAPSKGHSVKPVEFYELLERISPGPRLDMFARSPHEGFDGWGTEQHNLS